MRSQARTSALPLAALVVICAVSVVAAAPVAEKDDEIPVRPLPFHYDLYTFRGNGGLTEVVAAYAVPAKRLGREDRDGQTRYRFDVTLVLADTALNAVFRTDDSVFVEVPEPLHGEHLLHTHVDVQASPSSATLQRVVMTDAVTPGRGQLYTTPFPVPDYRGSRLMLSDIALGMPNPTSGWTRGAITLALLPTSQFPESSFDVYYEIYNLPSGHRYDTEITIEHLADAAGKPVDDRPAVSLRFFGESHDSESQLAELRRVDTALEKGRYLLTVEVTDEGTGRTVRSTRSFRVRGWGPGTTLVPAHSRWIR